MMQPSGVTLTGTACMTRQACLRRVPTSHTAPTPHAPYTQVYSAYLSPALRLHGMACYQVDEVTTMLWRYHRAIYGAFDYYAILYSEIGGKAEGREGTGE